MEPAPLADHGPQEKGASRRRRIRTSLIVAVALLIVFYVARLGWLFMMADEGPTPPLSAVPLPAGTQVVSESKHCGSGGCSVTFTVRPPDGMTPEQLAEEMGATPQLSVPGDLWDPRTVWVSARPSAGALKLVADYTSGEYVP
ncbi:hypothetical protein [Microbacterium sp. NPDC077486]|uniref:hypothetical protein n=1 Tax=Microbacterium sp. NPDC077486 TaxID=3154766 RepID=UPI00343AAB68